MSESAAKPGLLVLTSTFPRWHGDHEPAFVFELARRLTDRFEVTVLAPHAPGAADEERMEGVQVYRFHYAPERLELLAYEGGIPSKLKRRPWLALLVPWFLTAQLLTAFRLMRRLRPEVIHAHWLLPSGLIGALLQELPGARFRLVVTAHGADVHLTGGWLSRTLKREVLRSADLVTVVSRALRDKLADELPSAQFAVAPMGVDLTRLFTPGADNASGQRLIFAGRLVEKKGVHTLIEAMRLLKSRLPDCKLTIAGEGPMRQSLQAQAARDGLDKSVQFIGAYRNSELPQLMRGADVAVFPFERAEDGDQEGLGLVVIEAMGCGLPVIAGDLPAVNDMIRHGETGILFESGRPDRLAKAIETLVADSALRQRLATDGRAAARDQFDWSIVAKRYATLLQPSQTSDPGTPPDTLPLE